MGLIAVVIASFCMATFFHEHRTEHNIFCCLGYCRCIFSSFCFVFHQSFFFYYTTSSHAFVATITTSASQKFLMNGFAKLLVSGTLRRPTGVGEWKIACIKHIGRLFLCMLVSVGCCSITLRESSANCMLRRLLRDPVLSSEHPNILTGCDILYRLTSICRI